jgi:hypothetical protein
MQTGKAISPVAKIALAAVCLAGALAATLPDATAQGWWPWSQPAEPPRPREPMYRPNQPLQPYPNQLPPGQVQPNAQPGQVPGPGQLPGGNTRGVSNLCVQLEQRLVIESQGGAQNRDLLPQIENNMRQIDRQLHTAQLQLNRADCWDQFLFSRTLRRTQSCVQLNNQVETARRQLADLDAQRRQIMGTRDRSFQDDIIRELARNGCGPQYQQEARRRDAARNPFSSFFGNEESEPPQSNSNQFGNLPFATYRTLCVRLCDGYYFPVSFSTLPNHFQRDADVCQQQCAAPAELYYHQNPGGAVEQMVSASSQQPYTSLKSAWRYRKEFVQGCSCKEAEYQAQQGVEKKAEAPAAPALSTATARVGTR